MNIKIAAAAVGLAVLGSVGLAAAPALATAAPVVTSISPSTGVAGTSVSIVGTDLNDSAPSITFGSHLGTSVLCADADHCTVNAPAGHAVVSVRVTTTFGTSAATGQTAFLYQDGSGTARNVYSGLYLANAGSGANGSRVVQSVTPQTWTFFGDHTIRAANGKCLDVISRAKSNGARLQLYTCNGGSNQAWKVKPELVGGVTVYEIRGTGSGRCVDDLGYSKVAGSPMQIWSCNNTDNQVWHN
jgi:Ricin-type beta-trefoil lectin domain/IPT/TIG domain